MDETETVALPGPMSEYDEECIRAAVMELFGQGLFAREIAPCEFDPSWAETGQE